MVLLLTGTLFMPMMTNAQENPRKKYYGGFQVGVMNTLGAVSYFHEQELSPHFSLRGNLAFTGGGTKDYLLFSPIVGLESRWNYKNRWEPGMKMSNTNFVGFSIDYKPAWGLSHTFNELPTVPNFQDYTSFSLNWGIRRNLNKHFHIEAGAGVGYFYYFNEGIRQNNKPLNLNLNLRIGLNAY